MNELILDITGQIGGIAVEGRISREAEGLVCQSHTLEAAHAGTLSSRTGNHTGAITLSAGHGLVATDVIDIYWSGGVLYNMAIESVGGDGDTVITLDDSPPTAAGDNLPAQDTAVTVAKRSTISVTGDYADIKAIVAVSLKECHLEVMNLDARMGEARVAAEEPWIWVDGAGIGNPWDDSPTMSAIYASTADVAGADLLLGILRDNVD